MMQALAALKVRCGTRFLLSGGRNQSPRYELQLLPACAGQQPRLTSV
jgi:hypothetical protein